jgi:UDP-N-acetylmuramoyl-tripeptide--D-alanyl-D-alanine ligase
MDPLPIRAVLEAAGGRWLGGGEPPAEPVLEVSTDTRTLRPGALFVALRGERFDGNRFIAEALSRGARAALVSREPSGRLPDLPPGSPLIEVDDGLLALERLARFWRDSLEAEAIAITGTVGKTTTKEFLGLLLATRFPTVRAPRSFNNRLGVALTLLSARRSTRMIVAELGTSGPGELALLSRLVRPSRVIITEIGHAHLSGLGSLEGVVKAKAEIFQGLQPGGSAFIQEAAPGRETLAAAARAAGGKVVLFGWERGDYRITGCRRLQPGELDLPAGELPVGFHFRVRDPLGFEEEMILALPGRHNVQNALAAIAAARDAGLDWAAIRAGVRELTLPPRRFEVARAGGVTLVDDTYNASHLSTLAALEEAGEIPAVRPGGRRFLVLGDLLELGQLSEEIHREIGRQAARGGQFAGVISVGKESRWAALAAGEEPRPPDPGGGAAAERLQLFSLGSVEEVAPLLEELLQPGDLVLFKASRAVGLERAVDEMRRRLEIRPRAGAPREAEAPSPRGLEGASVPGTREPEGGRAACSTISIS